MACLNGKEFPVEMSIFEMVPDEEDDESESACAINIACAGGLPRLARALRLL